MLETIVYLAAFNAYLMKLMSKRGLLYKDTKYFKEFVLEIFWRKTPNQLDKFLRCVPCRMVWFCGLPQTIIYSYFVEYDAPILFMPLTIGVVSSFFYVIINPNHEEN
jgi:hypothetical protein